MFELNTLVLLLIYVSFIEVKAFDLTPHYLLHYIDLFPMSAFHFAIRAHTRAYERA